MKKLLLFLILACFVTNTDAQFSRLFSKKNKKLNNVQMLRRRLKHTHDSFL